MVGVQLRCENTSSVEAPLDWFMYRNIYGRNETLNVST